MLLRSFDVFQRFNEFFSKFFRWHRIFFFRWMFFKKLFMIFKRFFFEIVSMWQKLVFLRWCFLWAIVCNYLKFVRVFHKLCFWVDFNEFCMKSILTNLWKNVLVFFQNLSNFRRYDLFFVINRDFEFDECKHKNVLFLC